MNRYALQFHPVSMGSQSGLQLPILSSNSGLHLGLKGGVVITAGELTAAIRMQYHRGFGLVSPRPCLAAFLIDRMTMP